MRWEPDEEAWQYRLLDQMPSSLDESLLREAARMTPTQRLERMCEFLELLEEVSRSRGHKLQKAD